MSVQIGTRTVGTGHPTAIIAEIGVNHNGDVETALKLTKAASRAGCDFVKFQAGNPREYVNRAYWDTPRETPWGVLSYIEYRERLELDGDAYRHITSYCNTSGIEWLVSPLDAGTVDAMEALGPAAYKVASPMVTDERLLSAIREKGRPVLLSTGMSTLAQIDRAVETLATGNLVILHCTSEYPCPPEHINLRCMGTLRERYGVPVGYSGHEVGIAPSVRAASMGAAVIERHFTLSRAMWGSDHAASLETRQMEALVRFIREGEAAEGDGTKRVYEGEHVNMGKFRRAA